MRPKELFRIPFAPFLLVCPSMCPCAGSCSGKSGTKRLAQSASFADSTHINGVAPGIDSAASSTAGQA
jgi:hypothetical protein